MKTIPGINSIPGMKTIPGINSILYLWRRQNRNAAAVAMQSIRICSVTPGKRFHKKSFIHVSLSISIRAAKAIR